MLRRSKRSALWVLLTLGLGAAGASCGSSDDSGQAASEKSAGSACQSNDECASGLCEGGECALGSDLGNGESCAEDSECASGVCSSGVCRSSQNDDDDDSADTGDDDASGSTGDDDDNRADTGDDDDASGADGSGGSGSGSKTPSTSGGAGSRDGESQTSGGNPSSTVPTTVTTGPKFVGGGEGWRPMTTGCGPSTAALCTGECERAGGEPGVNVVRAPATLCFSGEGDNTPEDPSVVIEQVIEKLDGQEYVHLRVTFDPAFTDNTYGTGACCGWPEKRGHTFGDLLKSDHTELLLTDGNAETVMHFKVDLISADSSSACGYQTLGVSGGDGSMIQGSAAHVLAVATSLSRNLNGCGYCDDAACGGDCSVNSPATDESYTPNDGAPYWDYRQVYETWVDMAAFGNAGFGQAYITYTHSSPAKGSETIEVEPTPCPPDWDSPYCAIDDPSCYGSPGTGGASGSGGNGGSGGGPEAGAPGSGGQPSGSDGTTDCFTNEQVFVTADGDVLCTPIPFANYPGMAACPEGYIIDVASEGQYCLPE